MNVVTPTATFEAPVEGGTGARSKEWSAPDAEAQARRGASPVQLAAAALAGAVAAAIVAGVIFAVLPARRTDDPRALAVSRDVEDLKAQFQTMTNRMQELDTSVVAAAEPVATLGGTVKAHATSLESLRQDLDALVAASQRSGEEQARIATPALLGIAAVQLRSAVDRGAPFDWELVNLWGIASRHPDAAAELNRLRPLAGGVPSQRQIVADLNSLLAGAVTGPSVTNKTVQTIVWMLGGPQPPASTAQDAPLVSQVLAEVERGDYATGARDLRSAGPGIAEPAERIAVAMERRAIAQAATAKLMVIAKDGLSAQLRAVAGQQ